VNLSCAKNFLEGAGFILQQP